MATKSKITKAKDATIVAKEKTHELPKQIDVHYIKTDGYRTYYFDGVFGGLTPNGKLYIELFLQRQPTPQIIQHQIEATGKLGKELKRIGKTGMVREIEAGLMIDIETAKILKDWLEEKIRKHDEQIVKGDTNAK